MGELGKSRRRNRKHRQHITPENEERIMRVVQAKMTPEDREPRDVIKTVYRGNKQHWLRDMAILHQIELV